MTTRHKIDNREIAQEEFEYACSRLKKVVGHAQNGAGSLYGVLDAAWSILLCGSLLEPQCDVIYDAIRVGAQAGAAFFAVATSDTPVTYQLGDAPIVASKGMVGESLVHSGTWHQAFSLAILAREHELSNSLCRTPTELFTRSTTKSPHFHNLFVDAAQSFWTNGPKTAQQIAAVRAALDPTRPDIRAADYDAHHWVPELELLSSLHERPKEFGKSLRNALTLHHKYYSANKKRSRDWYGFIAMRPLIWAAVAFDRRVSFDVQSDYLPMDLVRGDRLKPKATSGNSRERN